jgi:hypothetical protein
VNSLRSEATLESRDHLVRRGLAVASQWMLTQHGSAVASARPMERLQPR